MVVYYTEMADQYASCVSQYVTHPFSSPNICQFVFNHQNGGFKRAGLFPVLLSVTSLIPVKMDWETVGTQ